MARARTAVVEEPQEVRAQARWLRITPRKARLVVENIRGRSVPEARTVLAFTPRQKSRAVDLGVLRGFGDVGATVVHALTGRESRLGLQGKSFLKELGL